MPKRVTPLTDKKIKNTEPAKSLFDGGGLHLIYRFERRQWRLRYTRPDGRENRIALGSYPEVSLKEARDKREALRKMVAGGIDPAAHRAAKRAEARRAGQDTFKRFAEDWLKAKSDGWADSTRRKAELCVHNYLVPALGKSNVRDITSADVVKVLQGMVKHAPALTRKASQAAQAIIRVAITAGAREDGRILDLNLRDNLPAVEKGHYPAATLPAELGEVLRAMAAYPSEVTRAALLMCAYTGQRPGDVAAMRWQDVNGEVWCIPKTKTGHAHLVPLPEQAVDLLNDMQQFTAGRVYVFPPLARQKTPHLHRDALSKALREAGLRGKQTPHGLRASLRTLARERLGVAADVLEAQLAHAKKGEVAAAYDRTRFDEERQKVMQQWADYLDGLRDESNKVVPIRRAGK